MDRARVKKNAHNPGDSTEVTMNTLRAEIIDKTVGLPWPYNVQAQARRSRRLQPRVRTVAGTATLAWAAGPSCSFAVGSAPVWGAGALLSPATCHRSRRGNRTRGRADRVPAYEPAVLTRWPSPALTLRVSRAGAASAPTRLHLVVRGIPLEWHVIVEIRLSLGFAIARREHFH